MLGYLDDLLLVPLGLALVLRLTPAPVIEAARRRAEQTAQQPVSRAAAAVIVMIWLLAALGLVQLWRSR